ncbi:MAG: BMP family ABC transporter substrate-binding protein, partial [Spirochaetes bacterium]
TEDSPTVVEVGQEHTEKGNPVYTFSHYSPMQEFGRDSAVSGQLVDWGVMYEKILSDIHNGTWEPYDLWWFAEHGAAKLGASFDEPINSKFVDQLKAISVKTDDLGTLSVYDLVMKRYEQMKQGRDVFDPYTGPIYDNTGKLILKEGERADKEHHWSIDYYVDNVVGEIPR